MMTLSRPVAITLTVMATFFWGASFIASKYLMDYLPPITAAALRFAPAALILGLLVLYRGSFNKKIIQSNLRFYFLMGLCGITLFNICLFVGLKYTSAINGSLIMATNPLVTLLLSTIFFKEPMTLKQKLGILLSFFGVAIVLTHGSLALLLTLSMARGDIIIMLGNICFALYAILNKKYVKQSDPLLTTACGMLIGATLLILLMPIETGAIAALIESPPMVYWALIFLSLCGSVAAYLFWNCGVAYFGAQQVSVFFNLVPVFAVLLSVVIGTPLTLLQLLGGALVISGVVITLRA